ncbi:uncharacterized protein A4U43_C03F23600 [Asparagus officinalis]|uniref:Uncharacterized protein n=1 Tax=Asparagus officinalis TaxID=4686 RepID=A0A5P1FEB2_ASPOF|nr:uncharacterized protein A4U43_C03F23600 [Asparagus officinalis]
MWYFFVLKDKTAEPVLGFTGGVPTSVVPPPEVIDMGAESPRLAIEGEEVDSPALELAGVGIPTEGETRTTTQAKANEALESSRRSRKEPVTEKELVTREEPTVVEGSTPLEAPRGAQGRWEEMEHELASRADKIKAAIDLSRHQVALLAQDQTKMQNMQEELNQAHLGLGIANEQIKYLESEVKAEKREREDAYEWAQVARLEAEDSKVRLQEEALFRTL